MIAYSPREVARLLVIAHRKANPSSRAPHIIVRGRNGSRCADEVCVLCRSHGPTWCNQYPKTERARKWAESHAAKHVAETSRQLARLATRAQCARKQAAPVGIGVLTVKGASK
jgi:hypothetical protein